jgi:SAM-dependent methyltransferase
VALTLTLTGERTVPGVAVENYWYRRHEAGYAAALPWCRGAVVLEAGCGEGYGARLLEQVAARVLAVDYDVAAVRHVAASYPTVQALRSNLVSLPVAEGTVEVVSALQVVEHLWDQSAFLAECARVLRPAGTLVLTTPNRLTFSPAGAPANPFHARELSAPELTELLAPHFAVCRLSGLRHGRRLRRMDARHGGIAAAQLAGPEAGWEPRLRRDVAAVRTNDFVWSASDVDTSLDLLVVAVRRPAPRLL